MQSSDTESDRQRYELFLKRPGPETDPPPEIIQQLKQKFNKNQMNSDLNFFGGQPVSLNRTHLNNRIFKVQCFDRSNEVKPNDYLICQKTDGVRFLLIITSYQGNNYLMSRLEGKGNRPVFYLADALKISENYDAIDNNQQEQPKFNNVVEILDGQLTIDEYKDENGNSKFKIKYLVFDILVHHKTLLIRKDLNKRLAYAELFVRGNNFGLQYKPPSNPGPISVQIQMKDFFEIYRDKKMDPDAKAIQFLFHQYIPSLPHDNDGIIFNDKKKEYLLGTNQGYLKWKPIQLNSVDFLGVPNTNIEDEYHPYKIIDLYLRLHSKQTNTYTELFEAFLVVTEDVYNDIENKRNEKTESTGEYATGLVLECNFVEQTQVVQGVYKKLYLKSQDYFIEKMMNQRTDGPQKQKFKKLKSQIFNKFWNILRIRDDRSAGNNADVADNIMKTIKENLTQQDLIKTSNGYFENIADIRRRAMGIRH